ncbi:unnamed protein product [Darwinula stevensoni]|uniref:Angiogenic factor with G patch and FHA domains 1 n=1 Tax=Darwinula stevensoni TaxID=69355 RepID=A0A7R9ACS1_9CRUS|nr:unnamed protein product [Darwinula stevensoni]CAG0900441.1 unnamed protein product [Darwinula stevensoni]
MATDVEAKLESLKLEDVDSFTIDEIREILHVLLPKYQALLKQVAAYVNQLVELQCKSCESNEDKEVQVNQEDITRCNGTSLDWTDPDSVGKIDVAKCVEEAASEALQHTGFVFEETSGLYYDYSSGYYYDAERSLYYDGRTGIYFYYNPESGKYEFHSQVGASKQNQKSKSRKRKVQEAEVEEAEEKEEGELSNASTEDEEDAEEIENSSDEESSHQTSQDISAAYPPCVRLVVKETSIDIPQGSVFIITCSGGTIGREGASHAFTLDHPSVSKSHARMRYNEEVEGYEIEDMGSESGTMVNENKIDTWVSVIHGTRLHIGDTCLECHIHAGQNTCPGCEPGLCISSQGNAAPPLRPRGLSKADRERERRKTLKEMKKKFGLEDVDYVVNGGTGDSQYRDRAHERREKVGIDPLGVKVQAASLDTALDNRNKGFQLLSKMGWKSGEGLGGASAQSCILEPVSVEVREGKQGLGSRDPCVASSATVKETAKKEIWKKTQDRYQSIQE